MGTIRVLEESIANQIAAGEVVERPASVVKELIENSLDAGASWIEVNIEGGGADLIRVSDNGSGMERGDAVLAFERHATSKIRSAEDLNGILSFGFRGEALPSIASVSRAILSTGREGEADGCRVRLDGGERRAVEPAQHPRGTTVEISDLFFNAPARRKFLRSRATETAHIADRMARTAAAHPAVAFSLTSGGRNMFNWPAVAGLRDRVTQMSDLSEARGLVEVERRAGDMGVRGLVSPPSLSRSTGRDQNLYVNGRPIRDRRLLHAIQQAYATLLPRGRYPVVYLFLESPPNEVDVNVHPAKNEVRFRRAGAAHDLVRESILHALGIAGRRGEIVPTTRGIPGPGGEVAPSWGPDSGSPAPGASNVWSLGESRTPIDGPPAVTAPPLFESLPYSPLAQFRETYILAAAPDGLMILDQHAAHERVLYERLLAQSRAGLVERQRLLFPITLDVTSAQAQAFEGGMSTFDALGFSVTPFGEGALRIDEVPVLTADAALERLVRELLDELVEWSSADGMERLLHRLAASAACHAAVRANHSLRRDEMDRIVCDLMETRSPMTCPHGRPAMIRLPLDHLEREFRRK